MNRKTLLVLVVVALLLLGGGLWVFIQWCCKPAPPPLQTTTPPVTTEQPARKSMGVLGETCCEVVPNPELKDQGRIVVAFPKGVNVSGTTVYVYQPDAAKATALNVAGGTFPLAPGTYVDFKYVLEKDAGSWKVAEVWMHDDFKRAWKQLHVEVKSKPRVPAYLFSD